MEQSTFTSSREAELFERDSFKKSKKDIPHDWTISKEHKNGNFPRP
jgi:hypothetical protein